jgi:hypothetical protein
MAISAPYRAQAQNGAILVSRGLVLALVRTLTLLLVQEGLAGTQGGAGT